MDQHTNSAAPQQPNIEAIRAYRQAYAGEPFSACPGENLGVRAAVLASYPRLEVAGRVGPLELQFPQVFAAMKIVGAHPTQTEKSPNPYSDKAAAELFANMGLHMVQALMIVEPLAQVLQDKGTLTAADALSVRERTLGHDLNKPAEAARRNAALIGLFNGDLYSDAAYEAQAQILRSAGVSDDMARYIVNSGADTGHGSFKHFVTFDQGNLGVRVRENWKAALVHLADDMAYSTKPQARQLLGDDEVSAVVTPLDRMILSSFESTRPKLGYPFMWKEGLGVDQHGAIVDVKDINVTPPGILALGSYAYFQTYIARSICAELKSIIAPADLREPEEFVRAFVQDALDKV